MTLAVPSSLDWMRGTHAGATWLDGLTETVAACSALWSLRVGEPFADSYVSLVLPATDWAGTDVVLKIQFPHRESDTEADALRLWDGNGAIRLLNHDSSHHALLLERCRPGDHLSTTGADTGLGVMIDLMPRLWMPAGELFPSLADEVARWIESLPTEFAEAGQPFERVLLDRAMEVLVELAATQGEPVLLHQDLHGDNVLRAEREPWLAIDPKPLVGEREFGLSPVIRSYEFGHSREAVIHRLDRLSGELGVDRERARLWAFGQAVAWGFERGNVLPRHLETARWLLDA